MKSLLLLACGSALLAQQYVISTYAGGPPPATPSPAVSGSIGAPISLAADAAGNVYFASPELSSVFKLDTDGVLTRVAGNGMVGYSGDGGPATTARLHLWLGNDASANAAGLAVDNAGNLFIADTGNHRIRRVSPDGVITTVAGNGKRGFSGDGGTAADAQLNWPWGAATDNSGNLYIVDAFNYRIRKVSAGGIITTIAGGGTVVGVAADGGPATNAVLSAWAVAVDGAGNLFIMTDAIYHGNPNPADLRRSIRKVSPAGIISTVAQVNSWSVAVDGSGNLFVAESSGWIHKVAPNGSMTAVAGNGTLGFSGDGGPATSAQLRFPWAVAVDGAGNLFIADRLNNRIRRVSASGIISTVAGDGTSYASAPGYYASAPGRPADDGKPATTVQLSGPWGVASDRSGNLFITDSNRIRKVSPSGIITTVAGNGAAGFSVDDGPAASAQLSNPIGVAADGAGNLFILEGGTSRIRKLSSDGIITTVAGNGKPGYSGDGGPATNAQLDVENWCNAPCGGVAVDDAGNLFIADSGNGRIRKVSPSGIITTVAGNGTHGSSGDGGPALDAQLFVPVGVAVDGAGNLFIAESGRVRKVDPNGIITTAAGGGQLIGSSADGGPATNARLSSPYALTVDGVGSLLIADPGWMFLAGYLPGNAGDDPAEHRIRRVSPSGTITTVAGIGAAGFSGDGGPASSAALYAPLGVTVDEAGNIYVADSGNRIVRILRPVPHSVLIAAVVDAASQRADAIAPGKIVVIYGAGLGPSQLIQNQPGNGLLSMALGGTVVTFNGIAAPLLYTSATQTAAIVPYGLGGSPAQVTVTYQGQVSASYEIPVATSAPGMFTVNQSGWGQAAAVNASDGTVNTAANPVKIGSYLSLYATGEGQTAPAGADGRIAGSTATSPVLPCRVTIGGMSATVQYAGSAPGQVAGLMQVNVQIPSGVRPGGYVPVVLQVGDRSSSPAVWIAVAN